MNYNNEKLKTTGESIQYLNSIILGLSDTNGVIPKAYDSPYTIQARLAALEEQGVPLVILDEVQQALVDLNAAVDNLETDIALAILQTQDSGWMAVSGVGPHIASASSLFIRRIGKTVNIMGFAYITTPSPLVYYDTIFVLPPGFRPKANFFAQVEYEGSFKSVYITTDGRVRWNETGPGDGDNDITFDIMFMTV